MNRLSVFVFFSVVLSVFSPVLSHDSPFRHFEAPVNVGSGESPHGFADSSNSIHAVYTDGSARYSVSPSPGDAFSSRDVGAGSAWHPRVSVSGGDVFVLHTYESSGSYFPRLFRCDDWTNPIFDGSTYGADYPGNSEPIYADVATVDGFVYIIADGLSTVMTSVDPPFFWTNFDNFSSVNSLTFSSTPGARYPALAASGSNVYAVWVAGGDVRFNRSLDNGQDWGTDEPVSSGRGVENHRPGIAAAGDWVFIVWSDGGDVWFVYSDDKGGNFSDPEKLAPHASLQAQPSIAVSMRGGLPHLRAAWTETSDGSPRIRFQEAYRTGGGFTWGIDANADGSISGEETGQTMAVSGNGGDESFPSVAVSPAGGVYVLWIDSSSGIRSARYSPEAVFPGEPAPPSGLLAAAGDSSVSLSWTESPSPDVVSYKIYRAAERGRWSRIAETEAGADSYSESGLVNGVIYWYAVKAVDRDGRESLYSNQASVTPQPSGADMTPPGAPAGLTASPDGDMVFLSWAANSEPDIRKYHVYSRTDARQSWQFAGAVNAPDTQFFHLNLTPGVMYQYVVTAIDSSNNESADSAPASANPGGRGNSPGSGSGCFIATAAFGSGISEEVIALSTFRDEVLLGSRAGRAFVSGYYAASPALAEILQKIFAAKTIIRLHLFPLIRIINAMS